MSKWKEPCSDIGCFACICDHPDCLACKFDLDLEDDTMTNPKTYTCDSCSVKEDAQDLPEGWTNKEFYLCPDCTKREPTFCPHCVKMAKEKW